MPNGHEQSDETHTASITLRWEHTTILKLSCFVSDFIRFIKQLRLNTALNCKDTLRVKITPNRQHQGLRYIGTDNMFSASLHSRHVCVVVATD
jgi:hypothetical protein